MNRSRIGTLHAPMTPQTLGVCVLLLAQIAVLSGCVSDGGLLEPIGVAEDAHSGGNALTVSPDSELAASGDWAGRIRIWRLPEGSPVASWKTAHGDLPGLMFLPDGKRLLSAGHDGFIRLWSLSGQLLASQDTGSTVSSFYPTDDRLGLLLGHADGLVSYWTTEGQRIGSWKLSDHRITAVAMAASGAKYAAADNGRQVWRWEEDAAPHRLQSPMSFVRSLAFNPSDGGLVGSGWFDLFSWPADRTSLTVIPTAHHGIVNHLQFSTDGSYLASISRQTDSAVMLLNPHTGETIAAFRKHALCGQRVALSPDGRSMVSNSDDASVRFYRLPASVNGTVSAGR